MIRCRRLWCPSSQLGVRPHLVSLPAETEKGISRVSRITVNVRDVTIYSTCDTIHLVHIQCILNIVIFMSTYQLMHLVKLKLLDLFNYRVCSHVIIVILILDRRGADYDEENEPYCGRRSGKNPSYLIDRADYNLDSYPHVSKSYNFLSLLR